MFDKYIEHIGICTEKIETILVGLFLRGWSGSGANVRKVCLVGRVNLA